MYHREQPLFSAKAHVFQIDPATKRNWIPASKHAVTVSFFYDASRSVYRIISVGGTKVRGLLVIRCFITSLKVQSFSLFNYMAASCSLINVPLLTFTLTQAIINSTITPNMTFTKTSQKFGQWADSRANTVYGLGFSTEQQLQQVNRFPNKDVAVTIHQHFSVYDDINHKRIIC